MESANLDWATGPCIHVRSGLVPRPRKGASARCRSHTPWRGSMSVIWFGAPFFMVDHFVGRQDAVARLKDLLTGVQKATGKVTVLSIEGPGGIGKTCLFDHVLSKV